MIRRLGLVATAAAGQDSLDGARGPAGGTQAGVQNQPEGIAHQVRGHLLDKAPGIDVTRRRCCPAAAALLLLAGTWRLRAAVPLLGSLLRIWPELGLQKAGDEVLGEGQRLRRSLLLGILKKNNKFYIDYKDLTLSIGLVSQLRGGVRKSQRNIYKKEISTALAAATTVPRKLPRNWPLAI